MFKNRNYSEKKQKHRSDRSVKTTLGEKDARIKNTNIKLRAKTQSDRLIYFVYEATQSAHPIR